jgi:uncharacterized protein
MTETAAPYVNKPAWVDLSSPDVAASAAFYMRLFGWQIQVSPDPQYGGYAIAKDANGDVAGIGPIQAPGTPPNWSFYLGTTDAAALGDRVQAAGGTVIAPAFDVGDQGRMAVFQDPSGAFISAWQPSSMDGFHADGVNEFGWAELSSRALDKAVAFYGTVFGWTAAAAPMGEGAPPYTTFSLGADRVAGGQDMNPMVRAEMPSYWLVYFNVADVDASFRTVLDAGGREMMPPMDFPGGRFAIVSDPQGAAFGLLRTQPR